MQRPEKTYVPDQRLSGTGCVPSYLLSLIRAFNCLSEAHPHGEAICVSQSTNLILHTQNTTDPTAQSHTELAITGSQPAVHPTTQLGVSSAGAELLESHPGARVPLSDQEAKLRIPAVAG